MVNSSTGPKKKLRRLMISWSYQGPCLLYLVLRPWFSHLKVLHLPQKTLSPPPAKSPSPTSPQSSLLPTHQWWTQRRTLELYSTISDVVIVP